MNLLNTDLPFEYCPGCTHSHLHRLLAQVIESNGWQDRVIGVCAPGCSSNMQRYFNCSFIQAPPGKAPAVATGIKRAYPDRLVFTYQGDGDLLSSGLDAFIHAAIRGEHLSMFCLNNLVMAAPGGQMSPTSIIGQLTATTPLGRSSSRTGYPLKISEIISHLPGVAFVQRVTLQAQDTVRQATLALKDAFLYQESGKGLSFVEVLGICPPYWHNPPVQAVERLRKEIIYAYPQNIYQRKTLKT